MSKYKCPLEVGDIVYHKSNKNLTMVVTEVDTSDLMDEKGYEGIECTWIDVTGKHRQHDFQPIELAKVISL